MAETQKFTDRSAAEKHARKLAKVHLNRVRSDNGYLKNQTPFHISSYVNGFLECFDVLNKTEPMK